MLIETMPNFMGEQLYPHGFPMPASFIKVNGISVEKMFIDFTLHNQEQYEPELRNYLIYYIQAPCWHILLHPYYDSMTFDQIEAFIYNNGLDPF